MADWLDGNKVTTGMGEHHQVFKVGRDADIQQLVTKFHAAFAAIKAVINIKRCA